GTREHALALLALLGDAGAHLHGTRVQSGYFHELADCDLLMDVGGGGARAYGVRLGAGGGGAATAASPAGTRWTASALPLGGGRVRTAHGALPVPAPATAALLAGYPWRDDGIAGERVTPTA